MGAAMIAINSWTIHPIDVGILVVYFISIVAAGVIISRRARQNLDSYFLGGRNIPWYLLGISNASGQFDITGTMWLVMLMFVYGVKSLWIPWVWPTFNQVFLMVFLAAWLRRSNVLTGAEWLKTRFSPGGGLELAHLSVVIFALVTVVSFLAYAFVGIGKFSTAFLPWDFSPNAYALTIMMGTTCYVVAGGMYSVVLTDLIQFVLLSVAALAVGGIAIANTTAEQIASATPDGWAEIGFGWQLGMDWSDKLEFADKTVGEGGYELFSVFIMMALLKGILASIAGPTPNYDMQRVLATRGPRESCLMSAIVSPILYLPRYFLIAGITVLGLVYYSEELAKLGAGADFEQVLPYVMQNFLPVGLKGILLAGLFAAFMSTFDSTINAGAAYLVNDVYKPYLRPNRSTDHYVKASYVSSLLVVLVGGWIGVAISGEEGWQTRESTEIVAAEQIENNELAEADQTSAWSIDKVLQWITGGLYGGYIAPNVIKWVWWRLNGYGYFAGMISGILLALGSVSIKEFAAWLGQTVPILEPTLTEWLPHLTPLNLFPVILVLSGSAAILVSRLTPPDDAAVLQQFCRHVRPWGFWRPVERALQEADPEYRRNEGFAHDMMNCAIGMTWQISLTALPVFVVLRNWSNALAALAVVLATSATLKFTWYDNLPPPTKVDSPGSSLS